MKVWLWHRWFWFMVRIRTAFWRRLFGFMGQGTLVYGPLRIIFPENVYIGERCTLNDGDMLNARDRITIGDDVHIGASVIITTAGFDYQKPRSERRHNKAPVTIEDGAWIAAGARIMPGVTIGHDAVVGAGSVVVQDVAPKTLVFGVPARAMQDLSV
jgi:acetyltransferase-like isoleucine patch superfamily enzyme